MKIDLIRLHHVKLPLKAPFTTSFATQTERDTMLVEVVSDGVSGWGECVTMEHPYYSSEYSAGAVALMTEYLAPRTLGVDVQAESVAALWEKVVGHRMAKAALETAILDAQLRQTGRSLAHYLGATVDRVPSGVSVGIQDSIPELIDIVEEFVEAGYVRIKIKIKPGWDIEPVRALRERFGDGLPLQVDANSAYTLADAGHLRQLDEYGLILIEQPLYEDDIRLHGRLAEMMSTPICLDESIVSARSAADAIALRAMSIVNIKPGRVGGYLEARRIHDIAQANGIGAWCGGMLESGLGRAANAALAALPGFTLPGDISASDRFYARDITEPFVLEDGYIRVPTGPGLGVEPIPELLAAVTAHVDTLVG